MGLESLFWREITNGAAFLIQVCMGVAILLFMVRRYLQIGLRRADDVMMMCVALEVYLVGVSFVRGGTWLTFLLGLVGITDPLDLFDETIVLGTALAIVGGLCCIRVWSRERWGNRFWVACGLISIGLPFVIHYLL